MRPISVAKAKKPNPERMFFDREPETWEDLEGLIQQAFDEMGYESIRGHKVKTVRGKVKVDVFARKVSTPIPTIVLAECKYWNKLVNQNVIHGFRTVCADAGAHFGLIVSKKGFQSGAGKARASTNVHLLNFQQFQDTFFDEWRTGIFMRFAWMQHKLFPISPFNLKALPEKPPDYGKLMKKYQMFWGYPPATSHFVEETKFPLTMVDPRGSEESMATLEVKTPREYFEVGKEAYKDLCKRHGISADLKPPPAEAQ